MAVTVHALLPYINFLVASSALAFQITVLYPSHQVLKQEQAALLRTYHELKIQRFAELERRMDGLERRMQTGAR
ncbi:hypothetical protein FB45DRAFT_922927 [Roridomyces roridus]|uniref:Uncharacterized protein n=1 Tax=Roridomyces roridus TaxID=1738132 RepID=A0AAD7FIH8_9AGAR|nr:hypothetical protein FB45DRAFT_922927 [Roridomyces roridus]